MTERDSPIDNVTPIGKRELAYLSFDASDPIREAVMDLTNEEYRLAMGKKALSLNSDYAQEVIRRQGALTGESAIMQSDMRKIITTAPGQFNLARYIAAEKHTDQTSNDSLYILRLGVRLETNTVRDISMSNHISQKYLNGLSIPVHASFPYEVLMPREHRQQAIDKLLNLILGDTIEDTRFDLRERAASPQAYVDNMRLVFRPKL